MKEKRIRKDNKTVVKLNNGRSKIEQNRRKKKHEQIRFFLVRLFIKTEIINNL